MCLGNFLALTSFSLIFGLTEAYPEQVQAAIDAGADVDAQDNNGTTAIAVANNASAAQDFLNCAKKERLNRYETRASQAWNSTLTTTGGEL